MGSTSYVVLYGTADFDNFEVGSMVKFFSLMISSIHCYILYNLLHLV